MAPVSLHDPFFRAVTSTVPRREDIVDLAAGRLAAIRIPDFLPRSMCEQVLRALESAPFDTYGRQRVDPPVMRFGVGVSDHRMDGKLADTYWQALEGHEAAWQGLGLPLDPFQKCRDTFDAVWPAPVRVGTRGGREVAAGVAREPNQGFQVHFDDALREFSDDLLDSTLVAQFAFNLYLSVPERGGESVVWRHRWHPTDERFRLPKSYGFTEEVVEDAEFFSLTPVVGGALLFDPRNYHAVRSSSGGRRIALGFSIGLTTTGELVTWS